MWWSLSKVSHVAYTWRLHHSDRWSEGLPRRRGPGWPPGWLGGWVCSPRWRSWGGPSGFFWWGSFPSAVCASTLTGPTPLVRRAHSSARATSWAAPSPSTGRRTTSSGEGGGPASPVAALRCPLFFAPAPDCTRPHTTRLPPLHRWCVQLRAGERLECPRHPALGVRPTGPLQQQELGGAGQGGAGQGGVGWGGRLAGSPLSLHANHPPPPCLLQGPTHHPFPPAHPPTH